ncbi:hypothetical protein KHA80_12365 [Anaerobacillus sp. HL2]|nr:hypothetical protein KHA80_12365 [Anaerobacillus sp. HL2]
MKDDPYCNGRSSTSHQKSFTFYHRSRKGWRKLNAQIRNVPDRISDLAAKESSTNDAIYDATKASHLRTGNSTARARQSRGRYAGAALFRKAIAIPLNLLKTTEELRDFDAKLF